MTDEDQPDINQQPPLGGDLPKLNAPNTEGQSAPQGPDPYGELPRLTDTPKEEVSTSEQDPNSDLPRLNTNEDNEVKEQGSDPFGELPSLNQPEEDKATAQAPDPYGEMPTLSDTKDETKPDDQDAFGDLPSLKETEDQNNPSTDVSTENTDTSKGPEAPATAINDENMAHEMAIAMDPVEKVMSNVNNSNLPAETKTQLQERLKTDIDALADKAKQEYERNQQAYQDVRESMLGAVVNFARGVYGGAEVVILNSLSNVMRSSDLKVAYEKLTRGQLLSLRDEAYALLGLEPQTLNKEQEDFIQETGEVGTWKSTIESPVGGKVTELMEIETTSHEKPYAYGIKRFLISIQKKD